MIHVRTKQVKNKFWYCYATINGYDHSFCGFTSMNAEDKMIDKIQDLNISLNDCKFYPPITYLEQVKQRLNDYI